MYIYLLYRLEAYYLRHTVPISSSTIVVSKMVKIRSSFVLIFTFASFHLGSKESRYESSQLNHISPQELKREKLNN